MKIKKIYEQKEEYYEMLGYKHDMEYYISKAYQLWTDAEGLEQLSADEHDRSKLTPEQLSYIDTFIELWNITSDFERIYSTEEFVLNIKAKKYNL